MRAWIIFLIALVVLIATAALAPVISNDPGYVLLQFGSWTVETTVVVIALAVLLLFVFFKILFWLLNAPRRAAQNLARRRMEHGLLALAEGNWSQAEKALQRSAEPSGLQRAGYLAAARAASSQTNDEASELRQQQYLEAADNGQSRTRFLLELSRARLYITRNKLALAIPILKQLRRRRRQHPQVLKMLAHCYREQGQWARFRELLPAMRKAKIIDRSGENDIHILAATSELQNAETSEVFQKTWESLLRPMRLEPAVVECYVKRALAFGLPRLADTALTSALDKKWDDQLMDLYPQCQPDNSEKALSQVEKWRRKYPDNAVIERVLGELCQKQRLWGKARAHLLESLRLKPAQKTYQILGELLERQGEIEAALRCYHNALQLSQGLPVKHQQLINLGPSVEQPAITDEQPDKLLAVPGQTQQLADQTSTDSTQYPHDHEALGELVTLPEAYHTSNEANK